MEHAEHELFPAQLPVRINHQECPT
jgi:hypothetical protein